MDEQVYMNLWTIKQISNEKLNYWVKGEEKVEKLVTNSYKPRDKEMPILQKKNHQEDKCF